MRLLTLVLGALLWAVPASATVYYVRTDGNNGNAGTTNSSGGAWATITFATDNVATGDTIRVQAGNYVEVASPSDNGTSGNTVTVVADGVVRTCGLTFNGQNYVRIIGLILDGSLGGCANSSGVIGSGTNTGLEFWNVEVGNFSGHGYLFDFPSDGRRCNACIWLGGSIHDIGDPSSSTALGPHGNDNFAAYLGIDAVCYIGIGPSGNRHRFLNIKFTGFISCGSTHPDLFYIHGTSSLGWNDSLVESFFGTGLASSYPIKVFHAQNEQANAWSDNVWRHNVVYNLGSASAHSNYTNGGAGAQNRWRYYNNTYVLGNRGVASGESCGGTSASGGAITYYVFHNIYDQCWGDSVTTNVIPWDGNAPTGKDRNLAYSPLGTITFQAGWTNQANELTNVAPGFVDRANADFTLTSGANARGAGGALTTATSCSGTTLNVAANTGSFFIGDNSANLAAYGGALVPGDFLTINSTTYQVVSRSGDALTLSASLTCSNGDSVYFGTSSTIDLGAYPYNAGGYNLTASYTRAGNDLTITPSDAGLVRYAICYEDGIPTTVDNASPFACTVGASTTLDIRVYPRYPSNTLYASAALSAGSSGPRPARRGLIR